MSFFGAARRDRNRPELRTPQAAGSETGHNLMGKLFAFVILLGAVGLIVESSFNPVYRLRPTMPPGFVSASSSWPPEKRAEEARIGQAYWDCAVNQIQWRYGYGYRLPQDPPRDFVVTPDLGADSGDSATRTRYWLKLQRVWYVPDNWNKSYQWDPRWVTDWMDSLRRLARAS
jgi:hypothetical protein